MHRDCIIGRYIAKEFIVDLTEELKFFIGVVKSYNQRLKMFDVYYAADKTTEHYTFNELKPCFKLFEDWYSTVSNKGQRFTRKQACPIILKSYRQQKFLEIAKDSHPSDVSNSDTINSDAASNSGIEKEKMGGKIAAMKVAALRKELEKHNQNSAGKKAELQQRLCSFLKVKMPKKAVVKPKEKKHGATWVPREIATSKIPFSGADFNDASLRRHLPGYSESKMPAPHDCHKFFSRMICGTLVSNRSMPIQNT